MRSITKSLLLIIILLVAGASNAQFVPDALSLVASPSSPSPRETVTVRAATPTFDKNTAVFSWSVDGKSRPDFSGLGKDSISLTAGGVGSVTTVRVNVSRAGSEGNSASLNIIVSDLALPWFAETYTPKWYKGKALPVANSVVSVAAIPRIIIGGRALRPEELIYRWDLDDEEGIVSGIGKETFRVKISDLPKTTHRVRVLVEDAGKRIQKEAEVFFLAFEPRVVIYPSSPLGGGEWRSAAANFSAASGGLLDFVAEPFFFSASTKKTLAFSWNVAGQEVAGSPQNPHIITLNTAGLNEGEIPISVNADDRDEFVPSAFKSFNLIVR